MDIIANELNSILEKHFLALKAIPKEKMEFKPSPTKWSKKEILGHTVDSAQNNIRRLVVAQYEDIPHISYNQDKWVAIAGYQYYEQDALTNLWYLTNKHLCHILKNMSVEMAARTCQTEAQHSLEWLANDYIKHLLHHLHQVLDLEPIAYP